jgi:hypothetical protein
MRGAHLVFVLALWAPAIARAEALAMPALSWDAPADCPHSRQVRAVVEHWLQTSVDPVDASALSVRAVARRDGDSWSLSLWLESPSGAAQERFTAKSCETLVDVVALKVALAASSAAALAASQVHASAPRVRLGARAMVGASLGELPGLSPSLGLSGVLGSAWLRLELGLAYAPPTAARYPGSDLGAEFRRLEGSGRACAVGRLGVVALPICIGMIVGVTRAQGSGGGQRSFTWDQLVAEVVVGPAARYPLLFGSFVWLGVDAALPLSRRGYFIGGLENLPYLYRPAPVALRVNFGIEFEF